MTLTFTATTADGILGEVETSLLLAASVAFFCPRCGYIWGRLHLRHLPGDPPWIVERRSCSAHGNGSFLYYHLRDKPGAHLKPFARNAAIPPALARYELSLLPPMEPKEPSHA